jgi:hypothetical protein
VRRGQALAESLGIELLSRPSDWPKITLIERLWRFAIKPSLDSSYDEDFGRFAAALGECLEGLHTVHEGRWRR